MGIPLTAFSERTQTIIQHLAINGEVDEHLLIEFTQKHISNEKICREIEGIINGNKNFGRFDGATFGGRDIAFGNVDLTPENTVEKRTNRVMGGLLAAFSSLFFPHVALPVAGAAVATACAEKIEVNQSVTLNMSIAEITDMIKKLLENDNKLLENDDIQNSKLEQLLELVNDGLAAIGELNAEYEKEGLINKERYELLKEDLKIIINALQRVDTSVGDIYNRLEAQGLSIEMIGLALLDNGEKLEAVFALLSQHGASLSKITEILIANGRDINTIRTIVVAQAGEIEELKTLLGKLVDDVFGNGNDKPGYRELLNKLLDMASYIANKINNAGDNKVDISPIISMLSDIQANLKNADENQLKYYNDIMDVTANIQKQLENADIKQQTYYKNVMDAIAKLSEKLDGLGDKAGDILNVVKGITSGEPVDITEIIRILGELKDMIKDQGAKIDNIDANVAAAQAMLLGIVAQYEELKDWAAKIYDKIPPACNHEGCDCKAQLLIIIEKLEALANNPNDESVKGDLENILG